METINILFVSPYFPYSYRNREAGEVFIYRLLKELSSRHHITLASYVYDEECQRWLGDIVDVCESVYAVVRGRNFLDRIHRKIRSAYLPHGTAYTYSRAMAHLIYQLTTERRFDVVQVEFTEMAHFHSAIRSGYRILDEHDVSIRPCIRNLDAAEGQLDYCRKRWEYNKMLRYERSVVQNYDRVVVRTPEDKDLLNEWLEEDRIQVIPHGVDMATDYHDRNEYEEMVIFVGAMGRYPNEDAVLFFANEVWPLIKQRHSRARLFILGGNPSEKVCSLSRKMGIVVTGYVEDLEEYYKKSPVFVAPLRLGGGIKVKVLEAWSYGLPVVGTSVAMEGTGASCGDQALVADDPQGLADAVIALLSDSALRRKLGFRGRQYVQDRFIWPRVIEAFEDVYADASDSPVTHGQLCGT